MSPAAPASAHAVSERPRRSLHVQAAPSAHARTHHCQLGATEGSVCARHRESPDALFERQQARVDLCAFSPAASLRSSNVSTPTTCTPIAANERLTGVALDGLTRADTGTTGTTSAQLQPLVGCAWNGYGEAWVDRPGRGFVRVAALPGLLARVARVGAALAPGEIDERELAEDSTALAAPCAAYSKQRACHACPAEFICSVSVALKVALRGDLSGTEERWRP